MNPMRFVPTLVVGLAACLVLPAQAWNRLEAETFATLPAGRTHPEGITADADGKLLRRVPVAGSSAQLLGLAFDPQTGELLVIDFGARQVLRVNPVGGNSTLFAGIPGGANAGPNALAFDAADNVYISDSFQGIVGCTGAGGGLRSASTAATRSAFYHDAEGVYRCDRKP